MNQQVNIQQDIDKLNNFCDDLARETEEDIKLWLAKETSDNATGETLNKTKGEAVKEQGEVQKLRYKIKRSLVFFVKGVGKGRGINSGHTKPHPGFNQVVNNSAKKLSAFVTENYMDRIVNISKGEIK